MFRPDQPFRKEARYTSDDGAFYEVPVTVHTQDEDDAGEDVFGIRLPDGKRRVVFADELTPRPDAPQTLIEQIEHFLTWNHPLLHTFVIEALVKYAEQVTTNREQVIADMKNTFISGEAWVYCAEEVIKEFAEPKA